MSDLRELGDISLPFALDEKKNYIYIKDAYRNRDYFCTCCGKKVNTIAIDEDKDYQMPPHYRHFPHQSCTGESLAHWVYKMWLFDKDSHFYVYNGSTKTEYIVKSIDIEKTYQTDFGDYRPDITITTVDNKVFFFELNFSNPKRSDDYFCKWSQINNDVIEVDVKKLLKESLNNKIPAFRLIYSEGICFDDKYNRRDVFADVANRLLVRKLEIQRQDMLNCKAIWEKLDWFFNTIKMYKAMKSTMDDVLKSFSSVPFEEMELCFNIVKKITCINNNDAFRDVINKTFDDYISSLSLFYNDKYNDMSNFKISRDKTRKTIWNIECVTKSKIGILEYSIHKIKETISWKKYYYSFSLYKEFEAILNLLSEKLTQHISQVLIINTRLLSMTNQKDIDYFLSLQKTANKNYDFINSAVNVNNIILTKAKEINTAVYDYKIKKLTETKYRFNDENEIYDENDYAITCKYKTQVNECNQITSIKFSFGSSSLENYLHKFAKLAEYCIDGVDEANYFLNLKSDDRYEKLVTSLNGVNPGKNMMNINAVLIISKLNKLLDSNSYLSMKIYCENANELKFKINIKVNHGNWYSRNYSEYSGNTIELNNNTIDGVDITNVEYTEIEKLIEDKLIQSKNVAVNKLMRFDGINMDTRFLIVEEGK